MKPDNNRSQGNDLAIQLHRVFSAIKSNTSPDQRPMHRVWQETLNVAGNESELYEALRLLYSAVVRLMRQIEKCPTISNQSKLLYNKCADGLGACLSVTQLTSQCEHMRSIYFKPEQLNLLLLASDHLSAFYPMANVSQDDLNDIKKSVAELDELIQACDIDAVLKNVLLSQVTLLRWTLENFPLMGIDAVYDAWSKAFIAFHRSAPDIKVTHDGVSIYEKAKTLFRLVLVAIDKGAQVARNVQTIRDAASDIGLLE